MNGINRLSLWCAVSVPRIICKYRSHLPFVYVSENSISFEVCVFHSHLQGSYFTSQELICMLPVHLYAHFFHYMMRIVTHLRKGKAVRVEEKKQ